MKQLVCMLVSLVLVNNLDGAQQGKNQIGTVDSNFGKFKTLTGHDSMVTSVDWSPNGLLASGSGDESVRIWDPQKELRVGLHKLKGHKGRVNSVSWSPNGLRIASGSDDSTVKIWNLRTAACIQAFDFNNQYGGGGIVSSVSWSPNGRRLALRSRDKTIKIWEKKGEVEPELGEDEGDDLRRALEQSKRATEQKKLDEDERDGGDRPEGTCLPSGQGAVLFSSRWHHQKQ